MAFGGELHDIRRGDGADRHAVGQGSTRAFERRDPRDRQVDLRVILLVPPEALQQLPHGFRRDTRPSCDLAIRDAQRFEALHEWLAALCETPAPRRIASRPAQGREARRLKAVLVSTDTPRRTAKGPGHVRLFGPAMLHGIHHRVRLGHPIGDRVVRHDHARDHHDAKAIVGPDHRAIVDLNGPLIVWRIREETRLSLGSGHGQSVAPPSSGVGEESGQVWVHASRLEKPRSMGLSELLCQEVWTHGSTRRPRTTDLCVGPR